MPFVSKLPPGVHLGEWFPRNNVAAFVTAASFITLFFSDTVLQVKLMMCNDAPAKSLEMLEKNLNFVELKFL